MTNGRYTAALKRLNAFLESPPRSRVIARCLTCDVLDGLNIPLTPPEINYHTNEGHDVRRVSHD